MKAPVSSSFPTISKMIRLHCHANKYDLDGFRNHLKIKEWKKLNPTFMTDFEKALDERLITVEEYADITDMDFDTEDELYEHLQEIFDYISSDA